MNRPGCALKAREPLGVGDLEDRRSYHIHVKYYNQNDKGLTDSIDEIDARVTSGLWQGSFLPSF